MQEVTNPSTHHVTAREDRISIFQKVIYSIGGLVNNIQAAALGSMVIVLNLGLGMNPALVGLIGAIPRIVDAISDPLVGYSSDNTRTRYGRRRPFIFFGALSAGLLFALMFQLYNGHSDSFYFWYFLGFQVLFFIGFTCYSIPWIALGYEMTPDYHERTRLQGASNFVAQFAWVIAPWFFKIMNNKDMFTDIVHGARTLALIIGAFIMVGGILPAIFNKEKFGSLAKPERLKGLWNVMKDFFSGFAVALKCRPFVKICAATFLIFNGFMLASAFSAYVIFFYVYGGDYSKGGTLLGWFGSISSVCTFCVIFLTTWISTKIGKRKTFLITISLSIIGYALKWIGYNPDQPYLLLIAAPFIAFGLGSLFTLTGSMVADVCDLDELQTGTRREGMFSAIYWWMVKLGLAVASLLSGILLNATGFNVALGAGQTAQTLLYMRICDIGIPIIASIAAIFIIMTFKISEAKAYDIRNQIERRREERRSEARRGEERRREARRGEA
ncbi:MAG: MFS transporter [Candidatus Omnitrophica bacterium]|nr:MFS transporter [Candidatus Omnitrophota bacterium]MBU4590944.1 MFS transporter [Candidatus Omnitrophota bacterium]